MDFLTEATLLNKDESPGAVSGSEDEDQQMTNAEVETECGGPSYEGPIIIGQLISEDDRFPGRSFDIRDGPTTVGRHEGNNVVLANAAVVSGTHALIEANRDEKLLIVRDLGSMNQTLLQRTSDDAAPFALTPQRIYSLRHQDRLFFGDALFRFELSPGWRMVVNPVSTQETLQLKTSGIRGNTTAGTVNQNAATQIQTSFDRTPLKSDKLEHKATVNKNIPETIPTLTYHEESDIESPESGIYEQQFSPQNIIKGQPATLVDTESINSTASHVNLYRSASTSPIVSTRRRADAPLKSPYTMTDSRKYTRSALNDAPKIDENHTSTSSTHSISPEKHEAARSKSSEFNSDNDLVSTVPEASSSTIAPESVESSNHKDDDSPKHIQIQKHDSNLSLSYTAQPSPRTNAASTRTVNTLEAVRDTSDSPSTPSNKVNALPRTIDPTSHTVAVVSSSSVTTVASSTSSIAMEQTPWKSPGSSKKRKGGNKILSPASVVNNTDTWQYRLLFTGYVPSSAEKNDIRQMGGEIVDDPVDATHIITNEFKRTVKLLGGICIVPHIVSLSWLHDSRLQKKFIELPIDGHTSLPQPPLSTEAMIGNLNGKYRLSDSKAEKEFGAVLAQVLPKRDLDNPILQGWKVHVTSKVSKPDPKTLYSITATAGAETVPKLTKKVITSRLIIISCEEDMKKKQLKNLSLPLYDKELVLSGIVRQKLPWDECRLKDGDGPGTTVFDPFEDIHNSETISDDSNHFEHASDDVKSLDLQNEMHTRNTKAKRNRSTKTDVKASPRTKRTRKK